MASFQYDLGKLGAECESILYFAAARDDGGGSDDDRSLKK